MANEVEVTQDLRQSELWCGRREGFWLEEGRNKSYARPGELVGSIVGKIMASVLSPKPEAVRMARGTKWVVSGRALTMGVCTKTGVLLRAADISQSAL
jgi:hypothetical protein